MCGLIGYSGRFSPEALGRGLARIRHRGPDDAGEFFDGNEGVGLGHARLSIIDLSEHGHQPMTSVDRSATLVFNGEIYNFRELRASLEGKGYRFRGSSDSEVLLNLYLAEGPSMLSRLNGIFAFAIWDSRDRSLFVARDGLGVKPLYYAAGSRGVAFASEIKALLEIAGGDGELDAASLHRYASLLWCPGEGTPLKSVRKLLPGHAMVVRAGLIERLWSWYQLPISPGAAGPVDERSMVDACGSQLAAAVGRQMIADVPVGAFLSGGLDSSAIVALAREQAPDLRCFTIEASGGDDAGVTGDLFYAHRVARHLGVELDVVKIDSGRMAQDIERMVYMLDEPLGDPAPLNVLYISQLARQQGIKVLLSGAGGDDLYSGYRRHLVLRYEGLWNWLPRSVRRRMEWMTNNLDKRSAIGRRLTKLFRGVGTEGDRRLASYFLWAGESDVTALYSEDFRRRLGESGALDPMIDFLGELPPGSAPMDRMLALEQRFFLADHNLNYTDKMSMAAGIEVRVPFLDTELVDFAATVPHRLKQRGREGKWVLKKSMERYLPRDVIYRPKSGFGVPLRRWMRHELRELLGDYLGEESLRRRGIFDPAVVQKLISDNDAGRVDGAYTLLSLLCIELWCRRFLDGNTNYEQIYGAAL